MKQKKRAAALLLALVMCLSALPVSAFAEKREFKVVAIGDSTSNGYGLDDYGHYSAYPYMSTPEGTVKNYSVMHHGFLGTGSKEAYPSRLAQYIAQKHPEYEVSFTNLAVSAMRNDEMRSILDLSFQGDTFTQYYNSHFLVSLMKYFGFKNLQELHDFFVKEVKNADVITLDACMNSFTDYMIERVSACLDGNDKYKNDTLASTLGSTSPEVKKLVDPVAKAFRDTLAPVFPGNAVTGAVDAFVYSFVDCLVNFSEIVELLLQMNPDVQLLVGGAYNPLHNKTFVLGGLELDLTNVVVMLTSALNTYFTGMDPNRSRYSFIEMPEYVETFADYMAKAETPWDLKPSFLAKLVDDIFNVDHTIARPLCQEACAEAEALGYDTAAYGSLYPEDIVGFIENVRTLGDQADPVETIYAEKFIRFVSYILAGARQTKLDVIAFAEAADAFELGDVLTMWDTPVEELTLQQRTKLCFCALGSIENGMGAHFSYDGCNTKYEAAVKAYEASEPASVSALSMLRSTIRNAVLSYRKVVQGFTRFFSAFRFL